jgi:hypothetical protein
MQHRCIGIGTASPISPWTMPMSRHVCGAFAHVEGGVRSVLERSSLAAVAATAAAAACRRTPQLPGCGSAEKCLHRMSLIDVQQTACSDAAGLHASGMVHAAEGTRPSCWQAPCPCSVQEPGSPLMTKMVLSAPCCSAKQRRHSEGTARAGIPTERVAAHTIAEAAAAFETIQIGSALELGK